MGVRMAKGLCAAMLLIGAVVAGAEPVVLTAAPRDYPHPDYRPTSGYLSSDAATGRVLVWYRGTRLRERERHPDVRSWAFELPEDVVLDRDSGSLFFRAADGYLRRLARGRTDAYTPPGAAFEAEPGVRIQVRDDWTVELRFEVASLPLVEAAD